jgi:hypothetical protein
MIKDMLKVSWKRKKVDEPEIVMANFEAMLREENETNLLIKKRK